ncbi:MAG: FkbM family methyltransferase [Planctomycetota bacterium]|jgi:FkbM family methyltransferase|nr:FkbM family methyltransferase [Planctomycetota bacterium]MDP6764339.1 FkbM family methyltransferase [Planctomycetota bacterium]MDP6988701.1 FkbM family methyltransferase [Planctomycetota bacterium]
MDATTRTVAVPELGIDFEVLADDAVIGPAIERGSWEDHETALFRAHLAPGARVVDLGANVGWFAATAILAGAEVDAFEPVPAIADIAERNMARAAERGPGSGRLHRFAAGEEPGTACIALGGTNHGDNRVLDEGAPRPDDMGDAEEIEIRIERTDDHVRGPVDVLKIDTQGSEWLALRGAGRLLSDSPRLALLLEFWPYALRGCDPAELLDLLGRQGFTIGKATAAPYPMAAERILRQAAARDPVKGGLDLYAVRGRPFHVLGPAARLRSVWRSWRED